jgi:hypothetical protein
VATKTVLADTIEGIIVIGAIVEMGSTQTRGSNRESQRGGVERLEALTQQQSLMQ